MEAVGEVRVSTEEIISVFTLMLRSDRGSDFSCIVRPKLRKPELDINSTSVPMC